jgi:hypothetical protein
MDLSTSRNIFHIKRMSPSTATMGGETVGDETATMDGETVGDETATMDGETVGDETATMGGEAVETATMDGETVGKSFSSQQVTPKWCFEMLIFCFLKNEIRCGKN